MIMEVLSGKINVERMAELQHGNPLQMPFKKSVIPGGEDENDDWIELSFKENDISILPFKLDAATNSRRHEH